MDIDLAGLGTFFTDMEVT